MSDGMEEIEWLVEDAMESAWVDRTHGRDTYSVETKVARDVVLRRVGEALALARETALNEAVAVAVDEAQAYRDHASLLDSAGNHHGATCDTHGALACKRVADRLRSLAPRTEGAAPSSPPAKGAPSSRAPDAERKP
jgi:hypothetical protein